MRRWLTGLAVGALVLGACSSSDESASTTDGDTASTTSTIGDAASRPAELEGYVSDQYADGANWLCHPDDADENVCDRDLDTTVVNADGTTEVEVHTKAADPPVDCFYVYPTQSYDPGLNSDLEVAENEEVRPTVNQVARLNSVCEVYAPVYRQVTLTALVEGIAGRDDEAGPDPEREAAGELAYRDVVDAWNHYLANDNDGRGVILVGHSQGGGLLNQLIQDEIDDDPYARERLVAAYLLGSAVAVPEGEVVGGDFENVPLCESSDQTGCVVSYASFPASSPPGTDSFFGVSTDEDTVAACTNPADLMETGNSVTPYFTAEDGATLAPDVELSTPWVSSRGVLTAECVTRNDRHVLEVTLLGDPTDTRDQELRGGLPQNWGLHLVDANLAMGELVALAAAQAAAYQAG